MYLKPERVRRALYTMCTKKDPLVLILELCNCDIFVCMWEFCSNVYS